MAYNWFHQQVDPDWRRYVEEQEDMEASSPWKNFKEPPEYSEIPSPQRAPKRPKLAEDASQQAVKQLPSEFSGEAGQQEETPRQPWKPNLSWALR